MFGSVRVRILLTEDKIMVRRDLNYSITLITGNVLISHSA